MSETDNEQSTETADANESSKIVTVNGLQLRVSLRYNAGHVLTSNEAGSMNQTFIENLRNNFANKIDAYKEAASKGEAVMPSLEVIQAEFDDYAASYVFGVRGSGGGSRLKMTPLQAEAYSIARDTVAAALKGRGYKLKDVDAKMMNGLVEQLILHNPAINAEAERRLAARESISSVGLELPPSVQETPSE